MAKSKSTTSAAATVAKGMQDILAGEAAAEQVLDAVNKRCPGVPRLGRKPHSHPRTEFTSKASNADGLSRRCKSCQSQDRKERANRKANAAEAMATTHAKVAATAKRGAKRATPAAKRAHASTTAAIAKRNRKATKAAEMAGEAAANA